MSDLMTEFKNIRNPTGITVLGALVLLTRDRTDFDYYLPQLVTERKISYEDGVKEKLIDQLKESIVEYSRSHKWSCVRALVRMLETIEGK